MTPTVSLVLPVSNQADHVEGILTQYLRDLSTLRCPVEVIVVVNASSDASLAICRRLAAANPTLHVVDLEEGGWGRAVRAGMRVAAGELIAYTNSARTASTDLIRLISVALENRGSVVKARRIVRDRLARRFGSLVYNLECRSLLGCRSWDVNGTPKIFPRASELLNSLTRDDDLIDAEFMSLCRRYSYRVIELPVTGTKRHGGRSTTGYGSALRMYRGVVELRRAFREKKPGAPAIAKR